MMPDTIPQGGWGNHATLAALHHLRQATLMAVLIGEAGGIVPMKGSLRDQPKDGPISPSPAPLTRMLPPTRTERLRPRRSSLAVVMHSLFLAAVGWLAGSSGRARAEPPSAPERADVDEVVAQSLAEDEIPGTVVPLIEREGGPWERFA